MICSQDDLPQSVLDCVKTSSEALCSSPKQKICSAASSSLVLTRPSDLVSVPHLLQCLPSPLPLRLSCIRHARIILARSPISRPATASPVRRWPPRTSSTTIPHSTKRLFSSSMQHSSASSTTSSSSSSTILMKKEYLYAVVDLASSYGFAGVPILPSSTLSSSKTHS